MFSPSVHRFFIKQFLIKKYLSITFNSTFPGYLFVHRGEYMPIRHYLLQVCVSRNRSQIFIVNQHHKRFLCNSFLMGLRLQYCYQCKSIATHFRIIAALSDFLKSCTNFQSKFTLRSYDVNFLLRLLGRISNFTFSIS